MSDASPSPTGPAGAPPEPRRSARDAALQLFNLRMIAAAFYFCLAMAGARSLTWLTHDDGVGNWLMEWLRFTRQTLLTAEKPGMAVWREKLFAWMMRNAATPMEFFRLPTNRVVELGSQVEI